MSVSIQSVIPIFRMFEESLAKSFYVDFLEFQVDWEHRFEKDLPLYMQVSNEHCTIHLTEHFGDCSPGSAIRVEVKNIQKLHKKLLDKQYKYARPGLEDGPGNTKEIRLGDPFGNTITFYEKN